MNVAASYEKLIDLLVQNGKISKKDRDHFLQIYHESGRPITQILIDEKIMQESDALNLLGESFDLPVLNLDSYQIDRGLISVISQKIAERYEVVPLAKMGKILTLASNKPIDLIVQDDLRELTGCDIRIVLASSKSIQNALSTHFSEYGNLDQVLEEAGAGQIEVITTEEKETNAIGAAVNEAPIVRMVNLIVQQAIRDRASDIHLEPYQDHFRIRYRIDGVLKETIRHSLDIYPAVIARMKILSELDITEKRLPQDGRFKIQLEDREIDLRVSILPTFFGEKAVLRLLDKTNVQTGLDTLGFSPKPIQVFKQAIQRPYGMILVTGPTGSGKSTTLYAVLNMLNTPERNLMSIEDPIEYEIEGITQTQVNPEIGLNFANGLRSLLRQSPDVILVGEIRDTETADITVKAALTGHLVLSTLHTNSAAGAFTRLTDMGVEPFLIASSIVLVAGQRLLRRICPKCKTATTIPPEVLKRLPITASAGQRLAAFKGKGCQQCDETGYYGRLGAIEVLEVDAEIRQLVLSRASSEEIEKAARKKGMEVLFENAFALFRAGQTTLEEVLRVTKSD